MEVKAIAGRFDEFDGDALVAVAFEGEKADEGALGELNRATQGVIGSLIETGEFAGKSGESAYIHNPVGLKARRLLLLGAGKEAEFTADTVRRLAGTAARTLRGKKARSIALLCRWALSAGEGAQAATEGALFSLFEPDKYHTSDKTESQLETLTLVAAESDLDDARRGVERGRIVAEAGWNISAKLLR